MDIVRQHDLIQLATSQVSPCVSIYLPVEVTGREVRQNVTRLKNLLANARSLLHDKMEDEAAVRRLLRPAEIQMDRKDFWSQRSPGLALFVGPRVFYRYWLPFEVRESLTVGDGYHLRPLLPAVDQESFFYLLAFSQNRVRLLQVAQFAVHELSVPDLPQKMEHALNYSGADRGAQVHSAMTAGFGKQAAVFHGQGGMPDTAKEDLAAFFRQIDAVVLRALKKHPAPLMLACVDYLAPIYRSITRVRKVMDRSIDGNPDYLSPKELHERAWPLLEEESESALVARLQDLNVALKNNLATVETDGIVLAAHEGQIETLYVDADRDQWGIFDAEDRVVDVHDVKASDDQDLIELAVVDTVRHHGKVFCLKPDQLPTAAPMAAMLRFR